MAPRTMLLTPTVTAAGRPLSAQWLDALTTVRVDLAVGLTGRAVLRFVDVGFALSSSGVFAMGVAVEIKAGAEQLLTGEVTGVALEQTTRQTPELVVTVDDKSCRLNGSTENRTFLNMTHSDVLSKIAGEAGLTARVVATTSVQPYQLQTGSNLAFLNAVCARAGLVWWVDGTALRVAKAGDAGSAVTLELGTEQLTAFSVRATNAGPEKVTVRGWNPDQGAAVTGAHTTKVTKESEFVGKAAGRAASQRGASELSLASPAPLDSGEAATMAAAKFAEASSAAVVAKGSGAVNGTVKLYGKVTVQDAGPASGSYVVTAVEHVYNRAGFRTHFTAGPVRPAGLVDLLGGPPPDPGMVISGVLPGIVTNLSDPDEGGRVKVKYTSVSDQVESAWARLMTLGAGKDRGMLFYPEVGDEVLIAFEQGDTRRPVVLGGLFSKKNVLPGGSGTAVENGQIRYRRITSRAGNMIELSDGSGPKDQYLLLEHQTKKHRIRVDGEELEVISDALPITLSNGQAKVVLAKNGDITLEGNNITLKAKSNVSVTANNKVTVKGSAGTDIGGAQVTVKADGMGSVEAGGPLTIKGAMVAIN